MITGASSGIGRICASSFARMGAELWLLCRNREKGEHTVENIIQQSGNDNIHLLHGDLSSLNQVRNVAHTFLEHDRPLHLLLNNAGVFNIKQKLTVDNNEEMFAVNHLAHFLLTNLLLDRIKASAPARIVNIASDAHWFCNSINFNDLKFEKKFKTFKTYGHSKLANILFNQELAKRLRGTGVTANALHPGGFGIKTGLGMQNGWVTNLFAMFMNPFLQTAEQGAETSIYVCTSDELGGVTGSYFKNCRKVAAKPWATDDKASLQLWQISEKLTSLAWYL